MVTLMLGVFIVAGGCVHKQPRPATGGETGATQPILAPVPLPAPTNQPAANAPAPELDRSEQIRNACLAGRRMICGKILEIVDNGVVVESGYTDLLREPLSRSWVVNGNVAASKDPNGIEANVPGTPCIGTVFVNLTDAPKRGAPPIHKYDYLLILAYPVGQYDYVPVPPIKKSIRKFTTTLELAVDLNLRAEKP